MPNYMTDPLALRVPFTESPFFESLLYCQTWLSDEQRSAIRDFSKKGYTILPSGQIPDALLDQVRADIDTAYDAPDGTYKRQVEHEYGSGKRFFEIWKTSKATRDLASHPSIVFALSSLYLATPEPFQTIHFKKGSNQPLHTDDIHFETWPKGYCVAAWTALEDIHPESGPLVIYPGTHRMGSYDFTHLGLPPQEFGKHYDAYHKYEDFATQMGDVYENLKIPLLLKKGQTVLFSGKLLHGGSPIVDPERTRYSVVTHYTFPTLIDFYHTPMVSDPVKGEWATKTRKEFRHAE